MGIISEEILENKISEYNYLLPKNEYIITSEEIEEMEKYKFLKLYENKRYKELLELYNNNRLESNNNRLKNRLMILDDIGIRPVDYNFINDIRKEFGVKIEYNNSRFYNNEITTNKLDILYKKVKLLHQHLIRVNDNEYYFKNCDLDNYYMGTIGDKNPIFYYRLLTNINNEDICFIINYNPIINLFDLYNDVGKIELFNSYDIIRDNGKSIVLDRLNSFLEEIGEEPVDKVEGYKNKTI